VGGEAGSIEVADFSRSISSDYDKLEEVKALSKRNLLGRSYDAYFPLNFVILVDNTYEFLII